MLTAFVNLLNKTGSSPSLWCGVEFPHRYSEMLIQPSTEMHQSLPPCSEITQNLQLGVVSGRVAASQTWRRELRNTERGKELCEAPGMKHHIPPKMIMLLNEIWQYSCKRLIRGSPAALQM